MGLSWTFQQYDLVLVLVLVMALPAEPLTGANVCHRLENYTLTVRESFEEPVQVQTSSWCLAIPPRCWRSRIEWRTRFRIKEEVRQKNVSECCEGYTRQRLTLDGGIIDKCVVISDCQPGYIGKNCDVECPEGFWGILCMHACNCEGNTICNRINGACNCAPGWQGSNCTEKCQSGKYGAECSLDCPCRRQTGTCHHVTGSCPDSTVSIDGTSEMSNWTDNGFVQISTVTFSAPISSSVTPIDGVESTFENTHTTVAGDSPATATRLDNSRTSTGRNEIALDSTVETTIITEYYEVNLPKVEESTVRPIVAVVRVAGKGSSASEKMIVTPNRSSEHSSGHTVPLSLDVAVAVVIGSIISLGLTTLVVLAILHVRSKLFETIRLSIYDAEKPDTRSATLPREKGNSGIQTINRSSGILTSCDYETPRCIIPERCGTLPRPHSTVIRESTYSNQYPNVQLFSSLRELMEAHYDRPPAINSFRPAPNETEAEHLYDEIPLQTTNFDNKGDLLK